MIGKHLSLPASHADWEEKLKWFDCGCFLGAHVAGFKPAIEWKGRPPTQEIVDEINGRNIYWGIHAPNNFADTAYNDWGDYVDRMEDIARLQPPCIVVHGGLDTLIDVNAIPLDDPIERYRSPISASEYLLACQFQHKLLLDMASRAMESRILVENTGIKEIASNAGVGCLCDVGHLSYSHNFFQRLEDYSDLPKAEGFMPASEAEAIIWHQLGLGIRRGEFPVTCYATTLLELIQAIGAEHYHLEGGYREEQDGHIVTHAPIGISSNFPDGRMRSIIKQLLQRENVLMCLKVDGSRPDGSGPFPDRQPTEVLQAQSWRNLCKITTELVASS